MCARICWSLIYDVESLVCTVLVLLLLVMVECWVKISGSGSESGKAELGICGDRGVWGDWDRGFAVGEVIS